jgi:hypothetical protein
VRFAAVDDAGNLTIGGLIETPNPVRCFEPQDRFVWFGYSNYDSTSTGLGRLDISEFTDPLTPTYASDLMYTAQGVVQSVVTWNNKRVFSINGTGLVAEDTTTPVSEGTLTSGCITYGIIDPKVAAFFDVLHDPDAGTITASLDINDGLSQVSIGTFSTAGKVAQDPFFVNGVRATEFRIKVTLNPVGTSSPVISRWTLRSYPAPIRLSRWRVPVLVYDALHVNGQDYPFNTQNEYDILITLHNDQNVFVYQEGNESYSVVMDDYTWLPEKKSAVSGFQGTFVAELRQIAGG